MFTIANLTIDDVELVIENALLKGRFQFVLEHIDKIDFIDFIEKRCGKYKDASFTTPFVKSLLSMAVTDSSDEKPGVRVNIRKEYRDAIARGLIKGYDDLYAWQMTQCSTDLLLSGEKIEDMFETAMLNGCINIAHDIFDTSDHVFDEIVSRYSDLSRESFQQGDVQFEDIVEKWSILYDFIEANESKRTFAKLKKKIVDLVCEIEAFARHTGANPHEFVEAMSFADDLRMCFNYLIASDSDSDFE